MRNIMPVPILRNRIAPLVAPKLSAASGASAGWLPPSATFLRVPGRERGCHG
ncbi:hypothetical protein GCM10009731_03700 [Streptomyces globosus]